MKRLAAIVPLPRRHTVRYFGVFAARAGLRARVIRKPTRRRRRGCEPASEQSAAGLSDEAIREALSEELGFNPLALGPPPMPERARRLDWASLLQRVSRADICDLKSQTRRVAASRRYQFRVLQCACGGRRKVTAFS